MGLRWNEKNYAVAHVNRECLIQGVGDLKIDNAKVISSLEEGGSYKFLGVLETVKQEDRIVLQNAVVYLQRLSIIWSSPLSDYHRAAASNQYALPVLTYFMWNQTWPLADLQQLDREACKVIEENGGNHPLGS